MAKPETKRFFGAAMASALVFALALAIFLVSPAQASDQQRADERQETEAYCLSCHNNPDLSMTLPSGEKLSVYISPETLQASVHSPAGIECEACHTGITTYPHPKIEYKTARELSRAYYQACQKCHANNYAEAQDSMHAKVAEAGNLDAPASLRRLGGLP